MKTFHCNACLSIVFFENISCGTCQRELAFIPSLAAMVALECLGDNLWRRAVPKGTKVSRRHPVYRKCLNASNGNHCNWAIDVTDHDPRCLSCRLTQAVSDPEQPGHRDALLKIESAKRRLMFSLLEFRLPIKSKAEDADNGIAFHFLADSLAIGNEKSILPVLTGHNAGTIVVNLAEADDAERERRRVQLHEPYRTLLGHLRHETGHYYWDRLIRNSEHIDHFRALFGDERQDYSLALNNHYSNGAPLNWQAHFVSPYASSHPWEDWAETWAHYLHITDSLETADACGLQLKPKRRNDPRMRALPMIANPAMQPFEPMIQRWFPLMYLLNNLNRGLGMADPYPFVLPPPALKKLQFVHEMLNA